MTVSTGVGDLDEADVLALHSVLVSEGGKVLIRWILKNEKQALDYLRTEIDEVQVRRAQGGLMNIQVTLDLFDAVDKHVKHKEPANG